MPASLAPQWIFQALTADGKVASGAKLYSYISGTSTPSPLYADEAMETPLSNPLELDAGGYGDFWIDASKTYRFRLVDADGGLIKERSNISATSYDHGEYAAFSADQDVGAVDGVSQWRYTGPGGNALTLPGDGEAPVGSRVDVRNSGSGDVTVARGHSTHNIDGYIAIVLPVGSAMSLVSVTATRWEIMASHGL